MKTRKLYSVRYWPDAASMARAVGYKGKMVPRKYAVALVRRLVRAGVDACMAPLQVNITSAQAAYLDRRYP